MIIDLAPTNPNIVSTRHPKLHHRPGRCCQIAGIFFGDPPYPRWSYRECIRVDHPRRGQGRPSAATKATQGYLAYIVGGKSIQ